MISALHTHTGGEEGPTEPLVMQQTTSVQNGQRGLRKRGRTPHCPPELHEHTHQGGVRCCGGGQAHPRKEEDWQLAAWPLLHTFSHSSLPQKSAPLPPSLHTCHLTSGQIAGSSLTAGTALLPFWGVAQKRLHCLRGQAWLIFQNVGTGRVCWAGFLGSCEQTSSFCHCRT